MQLLFHDQFDGFPLSVDGVPNLAPYSFFNAVGYKPLQVMFTATSNHAFGGPKDAVADAEATGEFVINIAYIWAR